MIRHGQPAHDLGIECLVFPSLLQEMNQIFLLSAPGFLGPFYLVEFESLFRDLES